jgi:hypothetical protein
VSEEPSLALRALFFETDFLAYLLSRTVAIKKGVGFVECPVAEEMTRAKNHERSPKPALLILTLVLFGFGNNGAKGRDLGWDA